MENINVVSVLPKNNRGIYGQAIADENVLLISPVLKPSRTLTKQERTRLYLAHELGHYINNEWMKTVIDDLNTRLTNGTLELSQAQTYIKSSATSSEEIGNDIHYGTRDKLIQNGISFTKRKAVKLRAEDYKKYDYIIGMEKSNVINIKRIVGEDVDDKIYRLLDFSDTPRDIVDPWYTGNFEITFNDIVEGCNGFLKCLKDKNIIDK